MKLNSKNFNKIRLWYFGTKSKTFYLIFVLLFAFAIIVTAISNIPIIKNENKKYDDNYLSLNSSYVYYDSTNNRVYLYGNDTYEQGIPLEKDISGSLFISSSFSRRVYDITDYMYTYASKKGMSIYDYARNINYTNFYIVNRSYREVDIIISKQLYKVNIYKSSAYAFKDGTNTYLFDDLNSTNFDVNTDGGTTVIGNDEVSFEVSLIKKVNVKRALLPIEKNQSITFIAASNTFDDVIMCMSRMPLYLCIALTVLLLVIIVFSIIKRRIYQAVFSINMLFVFLLILVGGLILYLSPLNLSFTEYTSWIGVNYILAIIFVISALLDLTFLIKVHRRYPKGVLGSKEYYEKCRELSGADKKKFVVDVKLALAKKDMIGFAKLLGLEVDSDIQIVGLDGNTDDNNAEQNNEETLNSEDDSSSINQAQSAPFALSSLNSNNEEEKESEKEDSNPFEIEEDDNLVSNENNNRFESNYNSNDNSNESKDEDSDDSSDDNSNDSNDNNSGDSNKNSNPNEERDKQVSQDLNTSFSKLAQLLNKK